MKGAKLPRRGYFITLEGGEGAGKTTLLYQLADMLTKKKYDVLLTREPGGTPLGNQIRSWLLRQDLSVGVGAKTELLLFLAARAQHIEETIRPALESGKVVICDRFNDSTVAYQGGARGLGVTEVKQLCEWVCGAVLPHLTFFLDVVPEEGLARSRSLSKEYAPSGQCDRIESEELAFHYKIRETLEWLAKRAPGRIYTLDAGQSQDSVYQKAVEVIEQHDFELFCAAGRQ